MKGNQILQQRTERSQAGFTLVELAIVMIIIGLLIAGVLKGQELIANAQVTSTVAQAKSIDAATSTFYDTYNTLPGDMLSPDKRLPNCSSAPCSSAGNGDGHLDTAPGVSPLSSEGERFFVHLNAANLLSGIAPGAAGSTGIGVNFPATKIGGNAFLVGSSTSGAASDFAGMVGSEPASPGTYLVSSSVVGTPAPGLRPNQALRIDSKLDDTDPSTGDVRGFGDGSTACGTAATGGAAGYYDTSKNSGICGIYIKIQN
jgi:prepilin-type N-terminal cleavage/methylation domain-containing protein